MGAKKTLKVCSIREWRRRLGRGRASHIGLFCGNVYILGVFGVSREYLKTGEKKRPLDSALYANGARKARKRKNQPRRALLQIYWGSFANE